MRQVDQIEEENYFFLMSKYQDRLINHIEKVNRNISSPNPAETKCSDS